MRRSEITSCLPARSASWLQYSLNRLLFNNLPAPGLIPVTARWKQFFDALRSIAKRPRPRADPRLTGADVGSAVCYRRFFQPGRTSTNWPATRRWCPYGPAENVDSPFKWTRLLIVSSYPGSGLPNWSGGGFARSSRPWSRVSWLFSRTQLA